MSALFDSSFIARGYRCLAGVDEAGRGPLAGPVVAAACCIVSGCSIPGIADSKKLSPRQRAQVEQLLKQDSSVVYGIGIASAEEIDVLNIRQASLLAMRRAVDNLPVIPDHLLIDGIDDPCHIISATPIVKGDSLSLVIAAASILAKEERDRMMILLDAELPLYGFKQHKGYPTAFHLDALQRYGPSVHHRRSFKPVALLNQQARVDTFEE